MILAANDLLRFLDRVPALGVGGAIVLTLVGLVLWLFGGYIIRVATVIGGLVIGTLAGVLVSPWLGGADMWWVMALLGGVVGGLLAALLFRVWMALAMALILAVLVPAAVLVWRGAPLPPVPGVRTAVQEVRNVDNLDSPQARQTLAHLAEFGERETQAVAAWWEELGSAGQRTLKIALGIASLVGVLLGSLLPKVAAVVQSTLVGALLWVAGARGLLIIFFPVAMRDMRAGPRAWLVLLGLITLVGIFLQWSMRRRNADKSRGT